MATSKRNQVHCSFCGRSSDDVSFVIPSPISNAYICNFCIDTCKELMDDNFDEIKGGKEESGKLSFDSLPTPHELKKTLDEYVIVVKHTVLL
ncbi:MAG: hypothetical protein II135_02715, partial [Clostridia bacterium]|nr:hypothetical protein [Clostridia bacterium]